MKKGWISLHRKIQDHWLWKEKPFDKRSAWIDLLMMANHKSNKFLLGNELLQVDEGSFITSQSKLMKRWGWGNTRVRNFLKLLKEDGMINYYGKKHTVVEILNYENYQKQTDPNQVIPIDMTEQQTDSKPTANRQQIQTIMIIMITMIIISLCHNKLVTRKPRLNLMKVALKYN